MKNFIVSILSVIILFMSCDNTDIEQTDNLDQSGILGQWKLESISTNGISDLSILCCEYIQFIADDELNDLRGEFTTSGNGSSTNGVFELNTANNTIHFEYDNSQNSYEFHISNNFMSFTYEENNQEIIEGWRKEE